MKKVILIICSLIISLNIAYASTLKSIDLPYFVKIYDILECKEKTVQVKKVYDAETLDVVFNMNFYNYNIGNNFNKYNDYEESIWTRSKEFHDQFLSLVYYGYLINPTDLNYVVTQAAIWQSYFPWSVTIINTSGNPILQCKELLDILFDTVSYHNMNAYFFYNHYDVNLWHTDIFTYPENAIILDAPSSTSFSITSNDRDLIITTLQPGEYSLNFTKEYEHETHCYSDGTNIYWQSLKGPKDLSFNLNYTVIASRFHINEKIKGYKNRYGDAKINESMYEIYLNDELKYKMNNLDCVYLNKNEEYLIKDISNNEGFNNIDSLKFILDDTNYYLTINKEVITKIISLEINNDQKYYVYLKSNNELYETVDSNNNLIVLPYGVYYITNKSGSYYQELVVHDSIDEMLVVDEKIEKETDEIENVAEEINNLVFDMEIVKSEIEQEELISSEEELEKPVEVLNNEINEEEVSNPQTGDFLNSYSLSGVASIFIFFEVYILNKKYL